MPPSKALQSNHRTPEARTSNQLSSQPAKENKDGASPMHAERLRNLYAAMLKCRLFQAATRTLPKPQTSCSVNEAVTAGAAIHLAQHDLVAPSRTDALVRLVQGIPLDELFSEFKPDTKNHLPQQRISAVDAELNIAAGMALACKKLHQPAITLSIHDLQCDTEFWQDAVRFASTRQLPVVFIFVSQGGRAVDGEPELRAKAQEFLPSITVHGNDVVAVYRVAEESTRRARQGLGPSLIECRVEIEPDPLLFMESYLKHRKLWEESWKKDFARSFNRELNAALTKLFGKRTAQRAIRHMPSI